MEIETIRSFCNKVEKELFENIIPFWIKYSQDNEYGGFYGRVSNDWKVEQEASKSIILNTRILWTFSALYQFRPKDDFLYMAERAYKYIINNFLDREMGGVYWLLDYKGQTIDNRKKIS